MRASATEDAAAVYDAGVVPEAPMDAREGGLKPSGEGWFVVNAREAEWVHNEEFGAGVTFEGRPHFAQFGINIQVIWPRSAERLLPRRG